MASQGECGNCKGSFEEHSMKITSIPSTWSNRKDNNHGPEIISVYEALSVVFEIPPLTPNNRGSSSLSGLESAPSSASRLSKKEVFKRSSKFTNFLQSKDENDDGDDDDDRFEGGYALCSNCAEMLTVTYNSLQDFVDVCKLESNVGKILKELEKKVLVQSKAGIREPKAKTSSAKPASVKLKEKQAQNVIVKSEPRDVEDNYDDGQEDDFLSQSNDAGQASVTSMAYDDSGGDDDDNGGDVSRPCSPDSYSSDKDVKFGKAAALGGRKAKVQKKEVPEHQTAPQRRSTRLRKSTKVNASYTNDISDDSDGEEIKIKREDKKKINNQKMTRSLKHRRKNNSSQSDDEYVPPVEENRTKQNESVFAAPYHSISQHNKVLAQSNYPTMKQLECPKCGKQFLHENTLICHRRLVHRENIALKRPSMNLPQLSAQKNSERLRTLASVGGKTSTCPVCRLELPRNEIRSHLSTHTRSLSKPWLCTICGVECSSQANLFTHHINIHKSCVPCKRCGTKIPKIEMVIHMRSCLKQNGGSGSFSCKNCSQTFKSSLQLMEHRSRVHGHVWRCKLCGSKFARRAKMIEHMQTHKKKKAHTCKICDKAYDRSDVLRLHVKRFHRNEGPPSVMKSAALETGDDGNDDDDTTKATAQDGSSQPTVSNAPPSQDDVPAAGQPIFEDRYICKPCDTVFRFFEDLEEHLLESHAEKDTSTCKICTRKFQDNYCLKLHLKVHSDTKPLNCFLCSKSYKDKNTFFYHIKDTHKFNSQAIIAKYPDVFHVYTKNPNRRIAKKSKRIAPKRPIVKGEFPCEICGKIFSYMGGVKRHIRIVHDKIKDFMCSYCGKEFSKKSYFQIHEKLHTTTEAPYKCHLCGKGFRLPGNLRMHLKSTIHNPNKDFVCEICGKGFNRMDNMKLHVKAVHMKIQIRKPRNRSGNSPPRSKRRLYNTAEAAAESAQNPGPSGYQQSSAPHETHRGMTFDTGSNSNTMGDASHNSSESNYQHNQQQHHQLAGVSMSNLDHPHASGHNVENVYSHSQGDYSALQTAALGFTFRGFQYR